MAQWERRWQWSTQMHAARLLAWVVVGCREDRRNSISRTPWARVRGRTEVPARIIDRGNWTVKFPRTETPGPVRGRLGRGQCFSENHESGRLIGKIFPLRDSVSSGRLVLNLNHAQRLGVVGETGR